MVMTPRGERYTANNDSPALANARLYGNHARIWPAYGGAAAAVSGRSKTICRSTGPIITTCVAGAANVAVAPALKTRSGRTHSMISASRSSRSTSSSLMVLLATLTPALSTDCGSPVSSGCHCWQRFSLTQPPVGAASRHPGELCCVHAANIETVADCFTPHRITLGIVRSRY